MRVFLVRSFQVIASLSTAVMLMGADGQGCTPIDSTTGDAGTSTSAGGSSAASTPTTTTLDCPSGEGATWLCEALPTPPAPPPDAGPPPIGSAAPPAAPPPPLSLDAGAPPCVQQCVASGEACPTGYHAAVAHGGPPRGPHEGAPEGTGGGAADAPPSGAGGASGAASSGAPRMAPPPRPRGDGGPDGGPPGPTDGEAICVADTSTTTTD